MIGAYSFQRLNYKISVLFLTPYLLILFSFLGENNINIAKERIIDTIVGSSIAFVASYLIFPNWEYKQLKTAMRDALIANYLYLHKVAEMLHGKDRNVTDYKLIRKQVYVSTANLGGAFQRMLSEPKNKQWNAQTVNKFTVINHMLSSYIANLVSAAEKERQINPLHIKWVRKAMFNLNEAIAMLKIDGSKDFEAIYPETPTLFNPIDPENWNEHLLNEQLQLTYKLTKDIRKIAEVCSKGTPENVHLN